MENNLKSITEARIKNAEKVTKESLIELVKNADPVKFDQMLIESEERKNYFFIKYKAISYSRRVKTLKFPLFKNWVNDFERNFSRSGNPEILADEKFINTVKSKSPLNNIDDVKESKGGGFISSKINEISNKVSEVTNKVGDNINAVTNKIDSFLGKNDENRPPQFYVPFLTPKYSGKKLVFNELHIIIESDKIKLKQPIYYIPNEVERCTCNTCKGDQYLKCPETECRGQHIYDCSKCRTAGEIDCSKCNARGEYRCPSCKGKGTIKCTKCDGCGRVHDGKGAMVASGNKNKRCDRCNGSGQVNCSSSSNSGLVGMLLFEYCGGSGIISCATCKASGKVTCDKCSGDGRIECKTCYSDNIDNRYGKVDCTTCETAGELASITYIETEIKTDDLDLIFTDGKNIEAKNFGVSNIKKFANVNGELTLVYKNLNGENKENYDNFSLFCSENSQKAVGISKDSYPKLLEEEMYYEAVPCATFNYNHILSASFHDVSVLSIDNEKEVFFHSDPTSVAEEKESIIDKIIELFKKAFSTRSYLDKLDRKHEMFLMVHMAKADGIVEEAEKRYLSNAITGLNGFTKKEKAELFNLMSASTLPPILPLNSFFSSKERAEEAKKKIIELVAKADGEYEPVEKEKIEEINKAIEQGFNEKPSKISRFFKTWQISVTLILLLISGSVGIYIKLTAPTENNSIVKTENKKEDKKDSTSENIKTTESPVPTKAEEKPEKTKPETSTSNETQKWSSYNFYGNNMTEFIEKDGKKFYYFTSNDANKKEMTVLSESTIEGTSIINVQLGSDTYVLNISGNSLSCVDSKGKPQVYNISK